MRFVLLLLTLVATLTVVATPVMANGSASATISISVTIAEQNMSIHRAAETDVCARLLEEDPAAYLESSCAMTVANHQVFQPAPDLLLVEPI